MFSTDLNSKETSVYQITSKRLRSQIYFFIFLVLLSKTITFKLNSTPFRKNVIVKEELDGIDIDDTGNLEDLLRIVFIHEE